MLTFFLNNLCSLYFSKLILLPSKQTNFYLNNAGFHRHVVGWSHAYWVAQLKHTSNYAYHCILDANHQNRYKIISQSTTNISIYKHIASKAPQNMVYAMLMLYFT